MYGYILKKTFKQIVLCLIIYMAIFSFSIALGFNVSPNPEYIDGPSLTFSCVGGADLYITFFDVTSSEVVSFGPCLETLGDIDNSYDPGVWWGIDVNSALAVCDFSNNRCTYEQWLLDPSFLSAGSFTLLATPTPSGTPTPTPTQTPSGTATPTPPVVVPPVPPLIDVLKVPVPLSLPNGPGPVTYTYTLRNIGTVPVTNITMVGDTCGPIVRVSGDTNGDSKLDVHETWVHRCTTTLSATHSNTVTTTGWANGISAVDIATATVIVGAPVVPPLIHVVKVANPLTLLAGGGAVTYTEKITNPGTVPLSNVRLTDDKCAAVKYVSGDANSDSKLDTTETWTYTCRKNLTKTTTNTATATGDANGLTAKDVAIVTVVVAVPNIPTIANSPDLPDLPASVTPSSGISLLGSAATGAAMVLWLILFVLALLDIARADKTTGWKLIWALVCLVLPVVGAIVYYFVARQRVSFNEEII